MAFTYASSVTKLAEGGAEGRAIISWGADHMLSATVPTFAAESSTAVVSDLVTVEGVLVVHPGVLEPVLKMASALKCRELFGRAFKVESEGLFCGE